MHIEIENVPVSRNNVGNPGHGIKFPFAEMQVGQSFKFPLSACPVKKRNGSPVTINDLRTFLVAVSGRYTKANPGVEFSVVTEGDDAMRVGRTA